MNGRVLVAALLWSSLGLSVSGQQPQPSPKPSPSPTQQNAPRDEDQDVVRITTNLVQVDVVVTRDGKPVTNLQPEDFEIFEDGKLQAITNFSYISNVPGAAPPKVVSGAKSKDKIDFPVAPAKMNLNDQRRTVALVIDDLGISWESMTIVRKQVRKFLDELSPNDLVAIIRTGGDVGSLQQFTNDKRMLQSAVDHIRWNPCSRSGIHVFEPAGSIGSNASICSQYVISNTLKSLRFILKGMGYLPGRKSMVLFSDYLPIEDQEPSLAQQANSRSGQPSDLDSQTDSDNFQIPDSGTSYYAQLQRVAELAIRSSVVIYSVDTRGLQYTGLTAADRLTAISSAGAQNQMNSIMSSRSLLLLRGREGSDLIARQSGGFLIRNSNDFGLKQIMEDQQGYYLIGYRPSEETFNRNFHRIRAKLKRSGMSLRTRAGFYGFTDEQVRPRELSAGDQMNKALISPFGANELTVRVTSFFLDEPSKGPLLRSFIYLDPRDLIFAERADGWHAVNLDVRSVLFGDNGRPMGQQDQTGTLRFRGPEYERVVRDGVTYAFDIPIKLRGAFQFRVAVRDLNSSHIGAAGQFVEIPNLRNGRLALSGIVAREQSTSPGTAQSLPNQSDAVTTGPAVRRFHQGSKAIFAYAIYNANVEGRSPQLSAQTRIVRDGKIVLTEDPIALSLQGQTDPQRITTASLLQIGSELTPGDYVFQIIVTDSSDKQKPRVASQWIDFEVVK